MVNFYDDIKKSIEVLEKGGLILYPTDTIWGIGCDATNAKAVEKIFALKKRPDKKSMIILVADDADIFNYVFEPHKNIFQFLSSAQKPTTVIYGQAKNLAINLINSDSTIAIRIVKDDFCKTLIHQFKKPIVSTSANISGEPYAENFSKITAPIKNGVEYIVQHRQNEIMSSQPSSIVKLNEKGEIEVIR